MKLVAAIAVYLGFGLAIGLGVVLTVAGGKPWLLLIGIGAFLFAFSKIGCLHHS